MPRPGEEPERRLRALSEFLKRAKNPTLTDLVDQTGANVVAAFSAAAIPSLVLKGPALARYLYLPGEGRTYMDFDVLVPPGERSRAGAVLGELGYESSYAVHGVDEFTGAVHAETWQSTTVGQMPVDLHWRLAGCDAPAELVWERLSAAPLSIDLGDTNAVAPGIPGLALHAAIHVAQHGAEDVKAAGDLERALSRWGYDQWRAAARLAADVGATDTFAAGLRLLPEGADMAARLELPATPDLLWEIENRRARPRGAFHLRALQQARGPRDVLRVAWRSLVPSPTWIRHEFPWAARGRVRLTGGYARHMLRLPAWAVRAWSYRRRARRRRDCG
jgi:hypothetical protein